MELISNSYDTAMNMAKAFVHLAYYGGNEPSAYVKTTRKYKMLINEEFKKAKELIAASNEATLRHQLGVF